MMKKLLLIMIAFMAAFAVKAQDVVQNFEGFALGDPITWMGWNHPADATSTVVADPFGAVNQAHRFAPNNFNALPFVALTLPPGRSLADYSHLNFRGHFAQGDVGWKTLFVGAFTTPPSGGFTATNPNIVGTLARNRGGSTAWEDLSIPLSGAFYTANAANITGTVYIVYGMSTAATGNIGGTGLPTVWFSDEITLVARPLVTSLEVTSPATEITVAGGTLQMSAINVLPAGARTDVTWSVSDANIATITPGGLLTAVTNGVVTVTAIARDGSGILATRDITITGQPVLVSSITVTGAAGDTTITAAAGTLQMSAAVLPVDATNPTVTWSVSDANIATISAEGLLTAVANGAVTVTATANDGSGVSGSRVITVSGQPVKVSSIVVSGAGGATTITTQNGTLQMSALVEPANATNRAVKWSVDNAAIATVNSGNGRLIAVSNGDVTVTATALDGSGVTGSLVVTVSGQVALGRDIVQNFETFALGTALPEVGWNVAVDIAATIAEDPFVPASGNKVLRSILTNWNAAPVLQVVLPQGRSLADYRALNFMGHFTGADAGWKDIHVLAFQTLPTGAMLAGSPNRLGTYNRARAASTAWEDITLNFTNAPGIAATAAFTDTVYIVFGMHANNATWFADEVTLVARPLVTSLEVTSPATEITVAGGTLQMSAINVLPAGARTDVTWSVSDTTVATISATGLLTAVSNGDVVVTATSVSTPAVSGTKTITVNIAVGVPTVGAAFSIYPVPVGSELNIRSNVEVERIEVLSLDGRVLVAGQSTPVDMSGLASGTYIVRVTMADGSVVVRTIVKK